MKKIFLLIISLTLFVHLSFAQIVALETARTVAKNIYYERANIGGSIAYNDISFSQDFVVSDKDQPVYFVFNVAGDRGFVIVSAEERAVPILFYSFEGSYNPNSLNENFAYWMNSYQQQIVAARDNNIAKDEKTTSMWNYYSTSTQPANKVSTAAVTPLLTTNWDQGCYYNALCPAMSSSFCNKCLTGCVATAMAMIMKYHSYPTHGYNTHTYAHTTANGFTNNFGNLTANFASTTYNWAAMPNSVNSANTSVATLMYHCGVAVEMDYDANGSGAFLSSASYALNYYFIYSSQYCDRAMYTDAAWTLLAKNSLDSLRPVLYGGQDATFGGHAFVCDGYQNSGTYTDMFHFNWGWSGSSNGYAYLSNVTPSSTSYHFTTNQQMVTNIHPAPATMPTANFTANSTSVAPAQLVVVTNTSSTNSLDYSWTITPNTGITFVSGCTLTSKNLSLRFANTGYYTLSLTVTNSAGSNTKTSNNYIYVWINDIGVEQFDGLNNITIFPNPSTGKLNIETGMTSQEDVSCKVYDIIGNEVSSSLYSSNVTGSAFVLDLSACEQGLYFIKLTSAKGTVTRKIELTK